MQDDQSGEQFGDQQPENGPSGQQLQNTQTNENIQGEEQSREGIQEGQSDQTTHRPEGHQTGRYQGVSEQIPFSSPPAPTPYQSGPAGPIGAGWSYPPRPEHYQTETFGQPQQPQESSVTQPIYPVVPGQFGQLSNSDAGLGASNQSPPGQYVQPRLAYPGVFPHAGAINNLSTRHRPSRLRTGVIIALGLLLAAVFASGVLSGWALSRSSSSSSGLNGNIFQPGNGSTVTVPQLTANNADAVREAVVSKVQPSVVQINVTTSSQHALGSGVIIDGRGYIVTNDHVVSDATSIQITLSNGIVLPAQLTGVDVADDLAVVKITPPNTGLTVVTLGDSSQLRVGQGVLAIGSPLGNPDSVTSGIVSALNRNVPEGQNGPTLPDAIQTDAPINPGNSGGALVDMQGYLIGIPTLNAINTEFNTPANGVGFAIPANRVKFIAAQIITSGRVAHTGRPVLGIVVATIDQDLITQNHLSINSGVVIIRVDDGSPAAAAGLQANDVIIQVNSAVIRNTSDLSATLLQHKPGESVAVKIYRSNQPVTVNVTLGELSAS